MRKLIYFVSFVLSLSLLNASVVKAQTELPSTSKQIFNWDTFDKWKMLDLFYTINKQGRKYPNAEELAQFGFDMEFARSHVRPASIIVDQATQVKPSIDPKRKLWMNVPGGIMKGDGGFPAEEWNNDVYTGWNYTHLFGNWNHGWFQAPGAFVSAAHKHGTDALSGLLFFDTGVSSDGDFTKLLVKEGSEFKYAEPLINLLMFMGSDGINYNVEGSNQVYGPLQDFHARLYELADANGFHNFHVGYYNNYSRLSGQEGNLWKNGKRVSDALMLNYEGNDFASSFSNSVSIANGLDSKAVEGLYGSTWIVTLNRTWTRLVSEPRINICLWGEHAQSRLFSYTIGNSSYEFQEAYQERTDRFFSGGNRNPANTPSVKNTGNEIEDKGSVKAMSTFHGLASFVAERSAVKGELPFRTFFNLGNGPRFHYKGKKAFDSWYNMGSQDMMPTYRWLVYQAGTKTVSAAIQPKFTHRDAYMGGSMLELNGTVTTTGTDVVLYRADLAVNSSTPSARVAFKMPTKEAGSPSHLSLILKTDQSGDNWLVFPIGNTKNKNWEAVDVSLSGVNAGDRIKSIGLRVGGASEPNYTAFVGEISIKDNTSRSVEKPNSLKVEVKKETTRSMTLKLNWNMDPLAGVTPVRNDYGLIYNDEVNVEHFEILYKNGENGTPKVIGYTNTWSHIVPRLIFHDDNRDADIYEDPYIGVRAASTDLKTYSQATWVRVPRQDYYDLDEENIERYCKSEIDPESPNVQVARANRWLKSVTTTGATQNLNYTANAPVQDGSNYVNWTHAPIVAAQGSSFDLNFVGFTGTDGLKYCFANAYVDWNDDGEFTPADGELVFQMGTLRASTPAFEEPGGVTKTFTVPSNAAPRDLRMRIMFQDAWFPNFSACGLTHKGFTIDFTLRVTGTNPPPAVVDIRDAGAPELPENWENGGVGTTIGKEELLEVSKFYPNPSQGVLYFEATDNVMVYNIAGSLVASQKGGVHRLDLSDLPKGIYLVKMEKNNVIRTQKLIKE